VKVIARHGFIEYYPQKADDLQVFRRLFDVTLVAEKNYFTFEALAELPRYSIAGALYAGLPALVTYEGRDASEVMRENNFVYSMALKTLVPTVAIVGTIELPQTQNYAMAKGPFVQPGSLLGVIGGRIVGYEGWLDLDYQKLYIYSRELSL